MSAGLVLVAYDRTDTQGVADSVVKYLERDHGYEVLVVGPGHARTFEQLSQEELDRARFFLELDAISGVLYHTEGLDRLRCPKLAWFVDTHKKPHLHHRIAPEFDLVFFTMWAWAGILGERARWLPVHYDPELIGPRPGVEPEFDVGFVGSQPRERTVVLQEIARRHGLSLLLETTTGPREKELTADLYARCRIVFNRHVANDLNFRLVEAQACGRLLITDAQQNGQYELFQDGEHVVYYKDDRDLERLLLHYLTHAEERERIAAQGHTLVSERHTTPARVREIVAAAEELVRRRSPSRPASRAPRVLVLGAERASDLARFVSAAGAEAVHVKAARAPHGEADLGLIAEAAERARKERFDLVVGDWTDAIPVSLVAGRAGLPFAIGLTALPGEPMSRERRRAVQAMRHACQGAGFLWVPSQELRDDLVRSLGLPAERIRAGDLSRVLDFAPAPSQSGQQVRYDREYMRRNNYSTGSPEEARLKRVQARLIGRVLQPRRALVAGCAAGELLRPLLEQGVDAWGFDMADDLETFVYPEVRERVLRFDVTELDRFPFARSGGRFDTLVAIDLFEHVEEERVDRMLDGIAAGFEQLALVISSSPAFEGHVCVKPFPWWLARLEDRGYELLAEPRALEPAEERTYGVKRFEGVKEDMSEQIVFLRRRVSQVVRRPRVSIGVVCCDRLGCLRTTVESTRSALRSSDLEVEWLAFDNGSSAPVQRYLDGAGFDLLLRSRTNVGLAPALDALRRESRGDYLLTLEDDWACLAEDPGWLEQAVAALDEHQDVGVVRLRRMDDGQCGHWKRHHPEVALRHHPWSIEPLPDVVETRSAGGRPIYVASAEYANWTHNPTLARRVVREWLGDLAGYLPDPRDHRPKPDHPGLEGAVDRRWRGGPWKVAKLLDGPYTHVGDNVPARVEASR